MKEMKTIDAVGQVLCHDITQIIKGVSKGPVFRKGHVIREEDIPVLLSVGKDHIYVWENDETMMHENDAAEVLCRICLGENVHRGEAKEGKIELRAACDGILKIDEETLQMVNSFGQMMIATRHGNFVVHEGDKLAGTRIIPLVIEKEKMEQVEAKAKEMSGGKPILQVQPLQKKKVGIVTTGNEVFHGRIQDTFTPVVIDKVAEFGAELVGHEYSDDDNAHIEAAIRKLLEEGADMILCTGGMSVDPDDRTPAAIRGVCGSVVTYGAPVLPGAMFLLAYYGGEQIPVMGLPGCVMYAKRTIFDLVLPRVIAGEILTKEDFDILGKGGLCLDCDVCTFPNCGFGKC
ncbi:MAG: molybdopterin-binding protein [Firmicutes bacterium]|nr:molybdopterin-binding protein [Bacillota bacterium]